jgi:hypothetical protein
MFPWSVAYEAPVLLGAAVFQPSACVITSTTDVSSSSTSSRRRRVLSK